MLLNARQLSGARTKIQRADEHLGQLRAEHGEFVNRNPYRMQREIDPERYYIWRAKIIEPPPLERWASLAGECLHALRSALDHTAYELVRINQPGTDYSEFPIFNDPEGWRQQGKRKLPGVDRKVLAQVKWLQPYRRDGQHDPLWVIHSLDIIDKHRRLNLISPFLKHAHFRYENEGDVFDIEGLAGAFIDGTPVARFRLAEGEVRVQTDFAFDIAFGEGLINNPVIRTLESLMVYVGGVVARFDRFFP